MYIDIYIYIHTIHTCNVYCRLIHRRKPNEPSTLTSHLGKIWTDPQNGSYTIEPMNDENLFGECSLSGLQHDAAIIFLTWSDQVTCVVGVVRNQQMLQGSSRGIIGVSLRMSPTMCIWDCYCVSEKR